MAVRVVVGSWCCCCCSPSTAVTIFIAVIFWSRIAVPVVAPRVNNKRNLGCRWPVYCRCFCEEVQLERVRASCRGACRGARVCVRACVRACVCVFVLYMRHAAHWRYLMFFTLFLLVSTRWSSRSTSCVMLVMMRFWSSNCSRVGVCQCVHAGACCVQACDVMHVCHVHWCARRVGGRPESSDATGRT